MTPRRATRLALVALVAVLGMLAATVAGRSGSDPVAAPTSTTSVPPPTKAGPAPVEPTAEPTAEPIVPPPVTVGAAPVTPSTNPAAADPGPRQVPVDPVVEEKVAADGQTAVLVDLDVPDGLSPEERFGVVAAAADEVLAGLPEGSYSAAKPTGSTPALALTVDTAGLDALRTASSATRVAEDRVNVAFSLNAPTSIQAPQAWARGADGGGQVIAVLDTGVARTHPYLMRGTTSDVLAEACFSSSSGTALSSYCPNGVTQQYGTSAAAPCPAPAAECLHGTHVAGIAAGGTGATSYNDPVPGFAASGIAPDARLLGVQVFSKGSPAFCGGSTSCPVAFDSDIIRGLEWVGGQQATYPGLAAVNLSLGGGRFSPTSSCDAQNVAMKKAIDDLRAVGIVTVVASGNNGWSGSISAPACISTAVAVGAVDDVTGRVASYSNISADVDILAPGSAIRSSIPSTSMGTLSGTSMATPAVAGAFAVLREARPDLTVDELLSALQANGTSVASRLSSCPTTLPNVALNTTLDNFRSFSDTVFTSAAPVRVMDTRSGPGETGKVGQGQCRPVDTVAAGVPSDAVAIVANMTAVGPTADTFLTAFTSAGPPNASNLNVPAGRIVPNLVTVKVNAQGQFQVYNFAGQVDVVVDVVGWYRPSTGIEFRSIAPVRVLDTRVEGDEITGGTTRPVDATRAGVPSGASAVVANLTVTSPSASSWFTAFPNGPVPTASNLNFVAGQTVANLAIVKLTPDGTFLVANQAGTAHLVVDVVGWFAPGEEARFTPLSPGRVIDTRGGPKLGAGSTRIVDPSPAGVPSSATAIVANVTATQPTAESWLTAFPQGVAPDVSSLNFVAGQTVPNLVTVKRAPDGTFRIRNQAGSTHVVVDVAGFYE